MRYKTLIIITVFLLAACNRDGDEHAQNQQVPEVYVVTLQTQPVNITTTLPGRTASVRDAEVRPQVSGIIQKRLFQEGTFVKAGQPLYQIDPATYQAAYDRAQATLENANSLVRRYRPLASARAISSQQYEDAVATQRQAEADVRTAQINLNYTTITAPIDGRTGRSLVTEGALVTNGQATYLTTIQQLNPIYVDISQSAISRLQQRRLVESGQLVASGEDTADVTLLLGDGSHYPHPGRLGFSEVIVDEGTGSLIIRATFPNPDGELLPGMFVHAELQQGVNQQGILVPQESVSRDLKSRPFVYVVKQDNTVEQRSVETGEMIGTQWLITNGLSAGERVITDGLQSVREGVQVRAVERAQETAPATHENLSMTDPSAQ